MSFFVSVIIFINYDIYFKIFNIHEHFTLTGWAPTTLGVLTPWHLLASLAFDYTSYFHVLLLILSLIACSWSSLAGGI